MADAISADGSAISSVDECDKCGRQMRKMQIPDEFGGEPGGSPFCMPCVRSCYETQPYRGTARLSDEEIGKPDKQDV